jgi:hypothetical protein
MKMVTLYRGVNLVLTVDSGGTPIIIGCVEGSDIDLGYEGGAEACYGTRIKTIGTGSKKISFTITRWYYADTGQEDLLLDMFDNNTEFTISGYLIDKDGNTISNTTIEITGCQILNWKPRTGGADDVLGEEARGFGTDWDFADFNASSP